MPLWKEEFEKKSITAQQAADLIKSGDRIMTGNRDCRAVLRRMAARTDLENVLYYAPIINFVPDAETIGGGIRPVTSFLNSSSHQLFSEGRLDFIPSEYWHYNKTAAVGLRCNVAFIEVTRPDKNGYMSMGTCTDFVRQACQEADLVIAETNTNFPFIYGSNVIHVSEVDYIVDVDAENYLMEGPGVDEDKENEAVYRAIGGCPS